MKITGVRLKDFRIHKELDLPLDQITVVVGANGSGKSSIKAAIEYALTGRCEWTDGRGAGAERLIRDGAKKAVVALDVEGIGLVQRTVPNALEVQGLSGNTTTQQAVLMEKLGATEQVIAAALNTTGFLGLDRAARKALVFGLLGFSFSREDIVRRLVSACPQWDDETPVEEWLAEHLDAGTYGPEVFAGLEEQAVAERRAAKRELKEAEARASVPLDATLPEGVSLDDEPGVRGQLEALRAERDELMRRLGEARSAALTRASRAGEVERLREAVAACERALAGKAEAGDPKALREAAGKLGLKLEQLAEERARAAASEAAARTKRGTLESAVASIEKAGGKCPLAPGLVQCAMKPDEVEKLLGKLRNDMAAADKEIVGHEKRLRELDAEIGRMRQERTKLESQAAQAEAAARERERAERELESSRAALAQAEKALADAPEPPDMTELDSQMRTLNERIAKGEALLAAIARYRAAHEGREQWAARLKRLQVRVEMLETLCGALGPKGIRAQILSEAVAALQEHANERCQKLTAGEYSIGFRVDEDLEILVTRRGYAPRPVELLSASEKFRVGLVVQDLLNSLAGLRLLVIDGADVLDVTNRALMMDMLLAVREDYDTILVLSALGDVEPVDPGIAGVSVYVLGDGGLRAARKAA